MAKDKKKHSKKDAVPENMLDVAALSVKRFRKVTKQITKLSTGQKVVGSIALLAAGFTYLSSKQTKAASAPDEATPANASADATADAAAAAPTTAPRKPRKSPKSKFSTE